MAAKEEKQDVSTVTRIFNSELEDFKTKSTRELKRLLGLYTVAIDEGLHHHHYFRRRGMITYLLELRGHDASRKVIFAADRARARKRRIRMSERSRGRKAA